MRSKKSYRISARFKDILDVLLKAKKSRDNFLWRSSQRKTIPILIQQIHAEDNTVEITLQKNEGVVINEKEELYLKLAARDSAFKTKVQRISKDSIVLEFPDEIALSENRFENRQYFQPNDEKLVQIKKVRNNVSSLSERFFELLVSDISQTGIALFLTPAQSENFKINDYILLDALGSFRINPAITGEIVFKIPHALGAKIGIQFSKKIPKVTFDRFCVREKSFSINEEQIVRTQEFRKNVHERLDEILKTLVLRRNFLNVFERLDMRQIEHQYLKQHLYFLSEVMCGLGTKLGWVTELTMDKLIYSACLHDARYFSVPKLAKIPSLKAFEKVKKTLTPDEQNVYMEGPIFATDLARHDIEAYPDASKILIQQKELPDGSGFPYGITTSQFLPLSCLFIVSHYFVDYVFTHQDWSVTDFIKTHEKTLKGIYFQKVFQAMSR